MNNFLELHTDIDYTNSGRTYFTGTWEHIAVDTDYLIPFHWTGPETTNMAKFEIYNVNVAGTITNMTSGFYSDGLITSWALTGTGTWTLTGSNISCAATVANDYITSNQITLNKNQILKLDISVGSYSNLANWNLYIKKGAATVYTITGWNGWPIGWDSGTIYYAADSDGSDYTVVIEVTTGSETVSSHDSADYAITSMIYNSGDDFWYAGEQLNTTLSDVFTVRVVATGTTISGSTEVTLYSDICDACGFTGKLKYKISSSYDFGGLPYSEGYEQWIYKDANVRQAPRADIEVTSDTRNGVRIDEKIVSAVRYVMRMRITEQEFETFVHSMGGTIEVTDPEGKVYSCTAIEMNDPTWNRSNGVLEVSFNDTENINIWTQA